MSYVQAMPGVMNATSQYVTGANTLNTNFRNNLNSAVTWFGDPTAWAPQNQPTVSGGLTSENGNNLIPAAPNQSLAQALGYNVDPAVAALARGNTIGPDGSVGNSIVAQLHMAAANARSAAIAAGSSSGGAASGSLGVNVNNQNIVAGQQMFNAVKSFQDQIQQANQGRITSIDQLRNNVINAITKGLATVQNPRNAALYPVQTQGTWTPVGTSVAGENGLAADQPLSGAAGYNPSDYVPGYASPALARRMQAAGYVG